MSRHEEKAWDILLRRKKTVQMATISAEIAGKTHHKKKQKKKTVSSLIKTKVTFENRRNNKDMLARQQDRRTNAMVQLELYPLIIIVRSFK